MPSSQELQISSKPKVKSNPKEKKVKMKTKVEKTKNVEKRKDPHLETTSDNPNEIKETSKEQKVIQEGNEITSNQKIEQVKEQKNVNVGKELHSEIEKKEETKEIKDNKEGKKEESIGNKSSSQDSSGFESETEGSESSEEEEEDDEEEGESESENSDSSSDSNVSKDAEGSDHIISQHPQAFTTTEPKELLNAKGERDTGPVGHVEAIHDQKPQEEIDLERKNSADTHNPLFDEKVKALETTNVTSEDGPKHESKHKHEHKHNHQHEHKHKHGRLYNFAHGITHPPKDHSKDNEIQLSEIPQASGSNSRENSPKDFMNENKEVEDHGKNKKKHVSHTESEKNKKNEEGQGPGVAISQRRKSVTIYTPSRLSTETRGPEKIRRKSVPNVYDYSSIVKVEDPEVQVIVKEKHGRKGLLVSITCPTEKAQLFYTFNGIQPNHNSFKYNVTGPFVVTENTTLKVIAMVRQNGLESNIVTKELKVH